MVGLIMASIVGNISDWGVFGLFNEPFTCEIWITTIHRNTYTMMISRGLSSIVSNVRVTFYYVGTGEGWYKDLFRTQVNFPTG